MTPKISFCVPTSWDDELIDELAEINSQISDGEICELYSALPESFVGSGRPAWAIGNVDREHVKSHIKHAQSKGFGFTYLLNGACMGNAEFTKEGFDELYGYLDFVQGLGAEWVTVSIPFLVGIIKKQFPSMRVKASTIAHVDSLNEARHWEQMGADRITLSTMINRNFPLLLALVGNLSCEVELLVNESCLFHCPFRAYHFNLESHCSQKNSRNYFQYPFISCTHRKLSHPGELIKSPWIRPEDIAVYQELGIRRIKLSGRGSPAHWIARCARAYATRKSPDNFADLITLPRLNVSKLTGHDAAFPNVQILNSQLGGFLDYFRESNVVCEVDCGARCQYCEEVADRSVRLGPADGVRTYLCDLEKCLKIGSGKELGPFLSVYDSTDELAMAERRRGSSKRPADSVPPHGK